MRLEQIPPLKPGRTCNEMSGNGRDSARIAAALSLNLFATVLASLCLIALMRW
jgi:hypothetical protein